MVNMLDCDLEVSKFELQLHYHIHLRTNALAKGTEPSYLPSNELNSTTAVLLLG